MFIEVGDSKVIFECYNLLIQVRNDSILSPYTTVENQTILIDLVPDTVEDGLYNIVLIIQSLDHSNKETKRGFFVQIGNACSFVAFW